MFEDRMNERCGGRRRCTVKESWVLKEMYDVQG